MEARSYSSRRMLTSSWCQQRENQELGAALDAFTASHLFSQEPGKRRAGKEVEKPEPAAQAGGAFWGHGRRHAQRCGFVLLKGATGGRQRQDK